MTAYQEFTNHMFLAIKYLQSTGKRATERQVLRLMYKFDYETLRVMVERLEVRLGIGVD